MRIWIRPRRPDQDPDPTKKVLIRPDPDLELDPQHCGKAIASPYMPVLKLKLPVKKLFAAWQEYLNFMLWRNPCSKLYLSDIQRQCSA
jgi:hypothetical protein